MYEISRQRLKQKIGKKLEFKTKKLLIVRIVCFSERRHLQQEKKKKASCKNLHTTIQLNPIFSGHGTQFPCGPLLQVQPHVHTGENAVYQ